MNKVILAVASKGGHWQQLMLVSEGIRGLPVAYVTTDSALLVQINKGNGFVVKDCNRNQPLGLIQCMFQCVKIVIQTKPSLIISTGAAPGLFCILFGKMLGAKTIWIDSIANVEKISMSGKLVRFFVDDWLTQWEHLSSTSGAKFRGALL